MRSFLVLFKAALIAPSKHLAIQLTACATGMVREGQARWEGDRRPVTALQECLANTLIIFSEIMVSNTARAIYENQGFFSP